MVIEINQFPTERGKLRLRKVTRADAHNLYRWRMEPETRQQFRDTREVPFEAHLAYLDRHFRPNNTDHWLIIEAAGEPIGALAIYNLSADGVEGEWGRFVLAPEHRGRGFGRMAVELLIEYARMLGLRRLRCEVLAGNLRAEAVYHHLGFRETGSFEYGGRTFRQLAVRLREDI